MSGFIKASFCLASFRFIPHVWRQCLRTFYFYFFTVCFKIIPTQERTDGRGFNCGSLRQEVKELKHLQCPHQPSIRARVAHVPGPAVGFVMRFLKKQRQEKQRRKTTGRDRNTDGMKALEKEPTCTGSSFSWAELDSRARQPPASLKGPSLVQAF